MQRVSASFYLTYPEYLPLIQQQDISKVPKRIYSQSLYRILLKSDLIKGNFAYRNIISQNYPTSSRRWHIKHECQFLQNHMVTKVIPLRKFLRTKEISYEIKVRANKVVVELIKTSKTKFTVDSYYLFDKLLEIFPSKFAEINYDENFRKLTAARDSLQRKKKLSYEESNCLEILGQIIERRKILFEEKEKRNYDLGSEMTSDLTEDAIQKMLVTTGIDQPKNFVHRVGERLITWEEEDEN